MKTYEIKTSRSRWTSLLIAVLLICMLVVLCLPYFTYGDKASTFAPAEGYASFLGGKWIISGTEPGQDGYKEIEIDEDVKTMTVNTTNIIRVNQLNADKAVETSSAAYADVKAAYESADEISKQLADRKVVVENIYAYITGVNAENAVNEGLIFEYFESEYDDVKVDVPKDGPVVLNAETIAEIQADAKKSYDKLIKYIGDAGNAAATLEADVAAIQELVNTAAAGAVKAYEADASYAWVTEDIAIFNAAFDEANPGVREGIVNDNAKAVEEFNTKTEEYNAALEKTTAAKAEYDAAQAEAQAKVEAEKKAYDDQVAAGEAKLAQLKADYDAKIKEGKAGVTEKANAYAAAVTAANEELAAIKAEFEATEGADVEEYNKKFADATAKAETLIAEAKKAYDDAAAANTAAAADLKTKYDADVAAAKSENDALVNEKKAAYDAALSGVSADYQDEKDEYLKLKKVSDAAKKAIPSKVAIYEKEDVDELVYATAGTNEELDNAVYGKLDAEKAKAAEGYAICKDVEDDTEDVVKEAEKAKKSADKALKDFDKEIAKLVEFAKELKCTEEFDTAAPAVEGETAPELVVPEYDNASEEPEMMTTTGKAKYNDKKNLLTLTFANGDEIETTFASNVTYNGTKELSILSYVGFPYNVPDFDEEMAYKIENYYINDVILLPIILLVVAVLGIIFCIIKSGKMSAGYLPAAFGLIGVFGYLFSDFMKLGNFYGRHIIGYAIILAVSALHIFFAIKEKKEN